MMSSINPTSSAPSFPTPSLGVLRRRIPHEMSLIREVIESSGLLATDEMTQLIDVWQHNFQEAMRRAVNEEEVCNTFIRQMQEILQDPFTLAPLDLYAVRGNDRYVRNGHTYGGRTYSHMSLAVYAHSAPGNRNRSPMDPQSTERFETTAHPVVRHMVRWLQQHNALLYSAELENEYVQMIASRRNLDTASRMARVMARAAADEEALARRRADDFDSRFGGRLQNLSNLLTRPTLSPAASFEIDPEITRRQRELEASLQQMAAEREQDFSRLSSAARETANPLRAVQEEIGAATEQIQETEEEQQRRIEEVITQHLDPLIQQVDSSARGLEERIESQREADRQAQANIAARIQRSQAASAALSASIQSLSNDLSDVSKSLTEAERQQLELQLLIQKTQQDIEDKKEDWADDVFKTLVLTTGAFVGFLATGGNPLGAAAGAAAINGIYKA